MKEFVEKFPQFKSVQTNAVKHMTLAGELGRIINTRNLLDTTELEQELATTDNHEEVVPKVVPGALSFSLFGVVCFGSLAFDPAPRPRDR